MKRKFLAVLLAAATLLPVLSPGAAAAEFTFERIPGKHGCDIFATSENAAEWLEQGLHGDEGPMFRAGCALLYHLLWPGARALRGIRRLVSGQAHSCAMCTLRIGDMPPNPIEKEGWVLTCGDEFDGPQLNEDIWHPRYLHEGMPGGPTDAVHSFRDGNLVLRIDRNSELWRAEDGLYVSGIHTGGKFAQKYGYFEVRAKTQTGGGIHCAFWTLGQTGEIDIFEQLGRSPCTLDHVLHPEGDAFLTHFYKNIRLGFDATAGFHIYALEWDETSLKLYVDNELVNTIQQSPQYAMYFILSMYMSEDPDYWTAPYNPDVPFPKEFAIDYFRAYQHK